MPDAATIALAARIGEQMALVGLDANPLYTGTGGAGATGKLAGHLETLPDLTPPPSEVQKIVEARARHDFKATQRGFSTNVTRTPDSFMHLLRAAIAQHGRVSPGDIWELIATIYGAERGSTGDVELARRGSGTLSTMPASSTYGTFLQLYARADKALRPGLHSLVPQGVEDAARKQALAYPIDAALRALFHAKSAQWQARVAQVRADLPRAPVNPEAKLAAVNRGLEAYLAHTGAAEAAGYKWREPMFEGQRSPQEVWIGALAGMEVEPGVTFADLLGADRMVRFVRAFEVANGLGGPKAEAMRAGFWSALSPENATARAKGSGARQWTHMGRYEQPVPMTALEAAKILRAWETGDFGALDKAMGATNAPTRLGAGNETTPGDSDAVVVEDARFTGLRGRMKDLLSKHNVFETVMHLDGAEPGVQTEAPGYRAAEDQAVGVVVDHPDGVAEAQAILDSVPRAIISAGDAAVRALAAAQRFATDGGSAEAKADQARHEQDAHDLLAYQYARVQALGYTEKSPRYGFDAPLGDIAINALLADIGESATFTPSGNHMADGVHKLRLALGALAKKRGWLVEMKGRDGDPSELAESPEFMRRVMEIAKELRPELGELKQTRPFLDEGMDPLWWMCGSKCDLSSVDIAKKALEEAETKHGPNRRVTTVHRNLMKALSLRRSPLMTFAMAYAREFHDPKVRTYVNSVLRNWAGSVRDRLGDPIANILGKYSDFYHSLVTGLTGKTLAIHRRHGIKISADLTARKAEADMTPDELAQLRDVGDVARALDGKMDPAALSKRAFAIYAEAKPHLADQRKIMVSHIFRHVTAEAQAALREGREINFSPLRPFRGVFGEVRDPQQVLDIVAKIRSLDAGELAELHGQSLRGWGIRDYHPHMWNPDADPTNPRPGSDTAHDMVDAVWNEGERIERWKATVTEDFARQHGFMSNHRRMRAFQARLKHADGWIEDSLWAMTGYSESLAKKVAYDRAMDDLVPMSFGEYRALRMESPEALREELSKIADERSDGAFGAVDPYFEVRITGNITKAGLRHNHQGRWVKAESKELNREARRFLMRGEMKSGTWRRLRSFERFGPDVKPEDWRLAFSDGRRAILLNGAEQIAAAGIQRRDGGLINYGDAHQYEAIKEVVRKATGYDMATGQQARETMPSKIIARVSDAVDALGRVLNHTQLGGIINTKAFMVQAVDGLLHNYANVGGKEVFEAQRHFGDFMPFWSRVITAADPQAAYDQALKDFAHTDYVRLVRPIMDASDMKLNEALRTAKQMTPHTDFERTVGRLDRASFLSFQLADLHAKETSFFASYTKFVEAGQVVDPATGRVTKIIPEAIPLGEVFKYGKEVVSAMDLARGVMERAQFTQPRWAMPRFMQLPGWKVVGHLGTIAANVTTSFWKGAGDLVKFVETQDPQYQYGAQTTVRYLVGIGVAYWLAQMMGRNIGDYLGTRPADIGFGDTTLGKFMPFLHALPDAVRVPAWQMPDERSMLAKMLISPKPEEGVFAAAGDLSLRVLSGEKVTDSFGDVLKPWWNNWSRTIGYGPWTRSGRPVAAMLNAQRSDLDPSRPWEVRDPAWFGPDGKTRHRNSWDLFFGDIVLPGWSSRDSAGAQRVEWERMKADVRGRTRRILGKDLKSEDPETRNGAYRTMIERGFTVEDWRMQKARMLDHLDSGIRRAIGTGNTLEKLRIFANSADTWPPAMRRLALRYILPTTPGRMPKGVDAQTWAEVQTALHADWNE